MKTSRIRNAYFNNSLYLVSVLNFTPNGCGSLEGWQKYTYKFIPDFIFKEACSNHDKDYFVGGFNQDGKLRADKRFLKRMMVNCEKEKYSFKFIRKPFYKKMAKLYYNAVLTHGERAFNMFKTEADFVEHCLGNGVQIKLGNNPYKSLIRIS